MSIVRRGFGSAIAGAILVAAIMVSFGAGPTDVAAKTAAKAAHPAAHHDAGSRPMATEPVVPFEGICDTAGVTDVFSDLTDADNRRNQIAFLQGRIESCSHKIAAVLAVEPSPTPEPYWLPAMRVAPPAPTPSPVCVHPPPATMSSNRFVMYETLGRCFAYWTYLSTLATPAPAASPIATLASRPTFYVFATGAADQTSASVLIRSVVDRLMKAQRKALGSGAGDGIDPDGLRIAARADWTDPASFTAQCQQDPNTRGALIIETSIPESYRYNYMLLIANFTNVSASLEMLGCGEEDHNPAIPPLSLWSQQALTGTAHETALTIGILSGIAPFFFKASTTTSVSVGGGAVNASSTTTQPPVFSGNTLSYFQDQNLNLPAQNASIQLTVAGERFADAAMKRLRLFCAAPGIRTMAAQADRTKTPTPPPEHRTIPYKAAVEYMSACAAFADFDLTH